MFATIHNTHFPQFMSHISEPRALAIDALSQDWQGRSMLMFPPFPLLSKVIQKHWKTQEGELILIAPLGRRTKNLSAWSHSCSNSTFLYYIFDIPGLSPQSIKGYRSCLASVLSHTGMAAAVQAKMMSDMITSMELQRPRIPTVGPRHYTRSLEQASLCTITWRPHLSIRP